MPHFLRHNSLDEITVWHEIVIIMTIYLYPFVKKFDVTINDF